MTTMTLNFLGTFSASRNGEPITRFRGDKVRALLAYLATEAERLHSRTSLAALLWPDRAADTALRNLSQTLLRLREALGDTAEESPLLTITRGAIGWRGEQTHVDVLDFARLARSVDVADLEQASALYRGEFLPGFDLPDANPFEEWLMLTRAQLEQQALTGLRSLTSHYLTVGQWARAADAARRQIALDRWREAAHRQLMRALMEGGVTARRRWPSSSVAARCWRTSSASSRTRRPGYSATASWAMTWRPQRPAQRRVPVCRSH
jgi:DNA-binding SARP family transcriptional activator